MIRNLRQGKATGKFTPDNDEEPAPSYRIKTGKDYALGGAGLKLARAIEHINELHKLCEVFADPNFCSMQVKDNGNGGVSWFFGTPKDVPANIPVLIGEVAHQIRSCLDHLIFHFAAPEAGKEHEVQMPICTSAKAFRNAKRRMPGIEIGSDVHMAIKSIQPYLRRSRPDNWLLWQVAVINNWDKHRSLPVTALAVTESNFRVNTSKKEGKLREGAITGVVEAGKQFSSPIPMDAPANSQVETKIELSIEPVFQYGLHQDIAGQPYNRILNNVVRLVAADILPRFDRLL